MKPLDQLWIRACKSKNPETRLKSVYRRFYCVNSVEESERYILCILIDVCKNHCPIETLDVISKFLEIKNLYNMIPSKQLDDYITFYQVLVNHIRFTEVKKIEGLTKPARFRVDN